MHIVCMEVWKYLCTYLCMYVFFIRRMYEYVGMYVCSSVLLCVLQTEVSAH